MKSRILLFLTLLLLAVSLSACGGNASPSDSGGADDSSFVSDDSTDRPEDSSAVSSDTATDATQSASQTDTGSESVSSESAPSDDPVSWDETRWTVKALVSGVYKESLPPLEVSDRTEPLAPGTPLPVAELRQAPQHLVGRQIGLDLKTDSGEDPLVVYSPLSGKVLLLLQAMDDTPQRRTQSLLLVLDTGLRGVDPFTARPDEISGTVVKIAIISPLDYLYPSNSISPSDGVPPASDGALAYGRYDVETGTLVLTTEAGINPEPVQRVLQRFGVDLS